MKKIVTVVGARPQFIKCAPVSRELRKVAVEILVHTGQHYDDEMSAVFFRELQIPEPDYNLEVGSGAQGAQTAEMLKRVEEVLLKERPDTVLVYGDTNSTLAGALAAAKLHIKVAHVEAGLRSFNRVMPEEINRILTDHVSDLLFCPTETGVRNLDREGIRTGVHLVGDVMFSAWSEYAEKAEAVCEILQQLSLEPKNYALATVHRAENTDDPSRLSGIMEVLEAVAELLPVMLPIHPRTRRKLASVGYRPIGVRDCPPVSYLEMLKLERNARVVLTDSGGVQKEAFWAGVPCVTLRKETEWLETVEGGRNRVAGVEQDTVLAAVQEALRGLPAAPLLKDDGRAVERILRILSSKAEEPSEAARHLLAAVS